MTFEDVQFDLDISGFTFKDVIAVKSCKSNKALVMVIEFYGKGKRNYRWMEIGRWYWYSGYTSSHLYAEIENGDCVILSQEEFELELVS